TETDRWQHRHRAVGRLNHIITQRARPPPGGIKRSCDQVQTFQVRTMPWYTGPHKDAVEASIKKYGPRPGYEAVPISAAPAANPWVTG
ncbi:hypothetical protein, partial [Arthrobacter sp. efr-133-TYG-120]|uniref:hypothetical protein n=1 Tax=Arthrobacter sp. efr-133-TYG-120 TaxID=3040280 RepID=UPI0025512CA8